jgi:hypothetical protein
MVAGVVFCGNPQNVPNKRVTSKTLIPNEFLERTCRGAGRCAAKFVLRKKLWEILRLGAGVAGSGGLEKLRFRAGLFR